MEKLRQLGVEIDEKATSIWAEVLEPIADDLLLAACTRFLRGHKWGMKIMPGSMYQAALEIMHERFPSPGEAWELARSERSAKEWVADRMAPVLAACHQIGRETMDLLRVGDSATRARFLEFYHAAVDAQVTEQLALSPGRQQSPESIEALPAGTDRSSLHDGRAESLAHLHGDSAETVDDGEQVDVRGLVRKLVRGEEIGGDDESLERS